MGVPSPIAPSVRLSELALLFLRLGATAFGGPAAHIALLEDEVVRRRAWLSREDFLDMLAATNLIPGPNSTEMAMHVGARMAGGRGLVVAGVCFILPAALIVTALAWAYVAFGALPAAQGLLYGVKPVILAVVLQALWGLGRTALKTRALATIALASAAAVWLGANELAALIGAGLAALIWARARRGEASPLAAAIALPAAGAAAASASLGAIFGFFLKVGAVLYGSGYVLIAFLQADLVERRGWLSQAQLLDAVAIGQFTPGPVFTTATFIGYVLAGPAGALAATVGIFAPAFCFVALSGSLIPRLRRHPDAGEFLDGVVAGSLALMAVASAQLARAAVVDPLTAALAAAAGVALIRFRVNSAWLVLAGGIAGWTAYSLLGR